MLPAPTHQEATTVHAKMASQIHSATEMHVQVCTGEAVPWEANIYSAMTLSQIQWQAVLLLALA